MSKFDQKEYENNYKKNNYIAINIRFRKDCPEEMKLLEHANNKPNRTKYLKNLISKDIQK